MVSKKAEYISGNAKCVAAEGVGKLMHESVVVVLVVVRIGQFC